MRDSLEKNLEPIETRFKYLSIPKKVLYADLYPLSKIVYSLLLLDSNYTLRRIAKILGQNEKSTSISRSLKELREKGFIKCEPFKVYNIILLEEDDCIKVPFELLYKLNNNAFIFYCMLKSKNVSNEKEAIYELFELGMFRETIKKYINVYKKLELI